MREIKTPGSSVNQIQGPLVRQKEFGIEGFLAALRQNDSLPTPQLLDRVLQSARAFGISEEFEDDVCLLAIEVSDGAKG